MIEKKTFSYEENIFTKIINRVINSEIILENKNFISFYDINPKSRVHILAIPKNKYVTYEDFLLNSSLEEREDFHQIIKAVIEKFNLENFNILINNGSMSGQEIFHFHLHILGK